MFFSFRVFIISCPGLDFRFFSLFFIISWSRLDFRVFSLFLVTSQHVLSTLPWIHVYGVVSNYEILMHAHLFKLGLCYHFYWSESSEASQFNVSSINVWCCILIHLHQLALMNIMDLKWQGILWECSNTSTGILYCMRWNSERAEIVLFTWPL